MAGFNWTSSKLQPRFNEHWSNLLGGVVAEFMACFVRTPFEVVKQQLQVGLDSTIAKTIQNIIKSRGVLGIYSGILPLLLRDAPYSAIFMPLYYALKPKDGPEESVLQHLLTCTLAASLAVTATQPMDVVKTHMMTSRSDRLSFLQTVVKIKAGSGFLGFYKAFSLRYANAVYFAMVFMHGLVYRNNTNNKSIRLSS